MLSRLELILECKDDIVLDGKSASIMHGVMMELVGSEYAERMHREGLRPYSQEFHRKGRQLIWTIKCMNQEAKNEIIEKLLPEDKEELYLRYKEAVLKIVGRTYSETTYAKLFQECYLGSPQERYISFTFTSPTAFKSNGKYINFPDIRLIFNSLINRYDAASVSTELKDDSLLEELERFSSIVKYHLSSTQFFVEGIKIPAFTGSITIRVNGNQNLVNLVNMLIRYGEYSGIGIKSAMGMGAIKIQPKGETEKNGRKKAQTGNRQFTA